LRSSGAIRVSLEDALGPEAGAIVHRWVEANGMRIEVDRRLYGHSSARVVAAFLQKADGSPERKIILKAFDTKSASDNEARRHQDAQRDAPAFAQRHLVDLRFHAMPYGVNGMVMFQDVAAGGLQDHDPLQVLIGTPSLRTAVGQICGSLLTEWNATGTKPERISLAGLLNQHLGLRIRPGGKIWSWADPVPQLLREPAAWLRIAGDALPNPFAFALSPRLSRSLQLRVQFGRVHGDLHANNLICSSPRVDLPFEYRLIDLASYDSDLPLVWDQASLLMSVVRHSLDTITDPVRRKHLLLHLTGEGNTDELPVALCDAIAEIRATGQRWAERHGQLEEWRRQFQAASVSSALILTGRSSLSFADRWWFFLLAARQLAVLLTRLDEHKPHEPFELDDATVAKLSTQPDPGDGPRRREVRTGQTPPTLTKPRRAWKQRTRHRINVNNLRRAASDDDFVRLACAYLFVAFGGLGGGNVQVTPSELVPSLVLVDTADHRGQPLRVAVQLTTLRPGGDWYETNAEESVTRIREFQLSDLTADHYLFFHTQDHRNERYNAAVLTALDALTSLDDVSWTGLWGCTDLVGHMWQSVYERCKAVIEDYTARATAAVDGLVRDDPITEVPFRRYRATFSHEGLESISEHTDELADPVPHLVNRATGMHLVVGEFGFGKTTVAIRASRTSSRRVLLLPAARLPADAAHLLPILSTILRGSEEPDTPQGLPHELWQEISPGCLEVMLTEPREDLYLIVDGLDEAPMAQRRAGVLDFLQALRKVNVPVLVSVRTEFWNSRRDEVRAAISQPSEKSVLQHITTTELQPWTTDCIVGLIDKSLQLDGASTRLSEFRQLVQDGRYGELYGDIPRRPLFLSMLIDDVQQEGVRPRSRLSLFTDWIDRKIERDWHNPKAAGGAIRPPIRSDHAESLDRTKTRAYQVMTAAARKMISFDETGTLSLLPTVAIDDVLDDGPAWFADVDPEALAIQSVLLPLQERALRNTSLFRFAHQAFQGYFLALSLYSVPDETIELAAPVEVREWLSEISSSLSR